MPFQAFELVTQQTSTRIPLDGALLGWDDEETQRVNEHLILNRPGAIHQDQGPGPRQFTFRCLLRDATGGFGAGWLMHLACVAMVALLYGRVAPASYRAAMGPAPRWA